jgi:hypothetical protein
MKNSSFKMSRYRFARNAVAAILMCAAISACTKTDVTKHNQASSYPADVLDKWMTLQLRLMRNTPGIPNQAFARPFAYSGIAALESLEPGLKHSHKWREKWNGLTGLPTSDKSKKYYLPANVNAAMAAMNKGLFANAPAADKAAIDSLENALTTEFLATQKPEVVSFSSSYGKAVASAVLVWAETDGASNANAPYTVQQAPASGNLRLRCSVLPLRLTGDRTGL